MEICGNTPFISEVKMEDFTSLVMEDLVSLASAENILGSYRSLECGICTRNFGFQYRKNPRLMLCSSPCLLVATKKLSGSVSTSQNAFVRSKDEIFGEDSYADAEDRRKKRSSSIHDGEIIQEIRENGMNGALRTNGNESVGFFEPCYGRPDSVRAYGAPRSTRGGCRSGGRTNYGFTNGHACNHQENSHNTIQSERDNIVGFPIARNVEAPFETKKALELARKPPAIPKTLTEKSERKRVTKESIKGTTSGSQPEPSLSASKPSNRRWIIQDHPMSPALKNGARCYVSHIWDRPTTFTLQAVEDESKVTELHDIITIYCDKAPQMSRVPSPKEIIFAAWNDSFYRCCVESVSHDGTDVCVSFVDYGDRATLKLSDCREPSDGIMEKHPIYGVKFECILPIDYPANLNLDAVPVSCLQDEVIMEIDSVEASFWMGTIKLPDSSVWNDILTKLILEADPRLGSAHGRRKSTRSKSSEGKQRKSQPKIETIRKEELNQQSEDQENKKMITVETSKNNQIRASDKGPEKPREVEHESLVTPSHVISNGCSGMTEKPTFLNMPLSFNLKDGASVHVNFMWTYRKIAVSAVADDDSVMQLQEQIERHVKTAPPLDRTPVQDDIILAPYDGTYYRAAVKRVDAMGVHVRFIDYGDNTVAPMEHLKELSDEIRSHPIYGLVAQMAGLPKRFPAGFVVENIQQYGEGVLEVHKFEIDSWKCRLRVKGDRTWNEIVLEELDKFKR